MTYFFSVVSILFAVVCANSDKPLVGVVLGIYAAALLIADAIESTSKRKDDHNV